MSNKLNNILLPPEEFIEKLRVSIESIKELEEEDRKVLDPETIALLKSIRGGNIHLSRQ